MGFLARYVADHKSMNSLDLFREIYGGRQTATGKTVNVATAIEVSVVFACNRVIGNGVAQVPLKLMRESADGKKKVPAKDHPLYNLMARRPNRWQTSFQYRQMVSWQVELTGDHYSYINRVFGKVKELLPFPSGSVRRIQDNFDDPEFEVTAPNGSRRTLKSSEVLHLHGPSLDGKCGLDTVKIAREAIGLALATEESASSLHKNGVRPSGVYSVEGNLSTAQHKDLTAWVDEHFAGSLKAGKALILDRAAKWVNTQMTGVDAQALETRRNQIEEICRFYGVMPIMAGYSDKAATYASAEQMFLAHVQHCLAPRWTDYEQAFDMQLLTDKEIEQGLFFNFVEEGMIRGSIKDTKDVILGYVNGGVLTPNEGRALLDRNPMDDGKSDELRIPANIVGEVATDDKGTKDDNQNA